MRTSHRRRLRRRHRALRARLGAALDGLVMAVCVAVGFGSIVLWLAMPLIALVWPGSPLVTWHL